MSELSSITRRDIFDLLENGVGDESVGTKYTYFSMREEELSFLDMLFDLDALPSYDPRFKNARADIFQHTVNNYDWEGLWVKNDDRFLLDSDDEVLLDFLANLFHPVVRNDRLPWKDLFNALNELLGVDGFELYESDKISGRSVYGWRRFSDWQRVLLTQTDELAKKLDTDYIRTQIDFMMGQIESAPHIAIGKAKELLETICKQVLIDRSIEYARDIDFNQLVKMARIAIGLTPENVSDNSPAKEIAGKILGNLGQIAHGLAELRNMYGDGHGQFIGFAPLPPRYAQLAVGMATAAARFIWETHIELMGGQNSIY